MRGLARRRAFGSASVRRSFSVVAWGANTDGQCGVSSYLPVLLQPREVEGLAGLPVEALVAAKSHSAAVLAGGEALTWGSGSDGRLGHGSTDSCYVPHYVESLAGRVSVVAAALGRQHTLFLDAAGQAWATGENKEGQCGLGTPLEELARQQRKQYEAGAQGGWSPAAAAGLAAPSGGGGGGAQRGGPGGAASAAQQQAYEQQQFARSVEWYARHGWQAANLVPLVEHAGRAAELEAATAMYTSDLRSLMARQSAWQRFEAARGSDVSIPGLMPGQIAAPVRLGRARQGLFSPGLPELAGLEAERIVQLAAGRFMSAAVTAAGEVWTFGGGFNGELGSGGGGTWSPAPRRVGGALAQVLRDNGGAVKVAAGGAFCVALTRSGRVVLWGQPSGSEALRGAPAATAAAAAAAGMSRGHGRRRRPGGWLPPAARAALQHRQQQQQQQQQLGQPDGNSSSSTVLDSSSSSSSSIGAAFESSSGGSSGASGSGGEAEEEELVGHLRIRRQPGALVAELVGLPPMTDVAAGFSHLAMTDGASVWTVGRLGPGGGGGGSPPDPSWLQPRRAMHRPDDGIASLAGGAFAAAAVTGGGELHLWGTLLTREGAAALLQKSEDEGFGHWAHSSTSDAAATQWSGWEGLGGPEPRRVPGLHGVQRVALGSHHALAVVA